MVVSEDQRFQMHLGLRELLGDDVASTLMEHLPPYGWADVARKSDIDRLDSRLDNLDSRLGGVIAGMWAIGSIMMTGFIGLFAIIAIKL